MICTKKLYKNISRMFLDYVKRHAMFYFMEKEVIEYEE